jgi:hypothetical protein
MKKSKIKLSVFALSILFTALLFTACTKSNQNYNCSSVLPQKLDTVKIQPSMKGWELYSWAGNEQSCDNWNLHYPAWYKQD